MQNIHGGVLIDHRRAFRAADVMSDQLAFDRGRGQPLVPQRDRQRRELGEVAGEGSGRLRARAFRAVHVDGQAEHEADCGALGGKRQQAVGVGGEIGARDGLDPGCKSAVGIARGHADGFGAEVEADQRPAFGQMRGGFHEGQYDSHRRSDST